MRLLFSKILFILGDLISNLLYFKFMGIIFYPIYKKLMIWSSDLDKDGIIWHYIDDEK
jgi:hypothetical protein